MEALFRHSVEPLVASSRKGVLLAVSGGVDSMVMAHLFLQWRGLPLAVAHMNFLLRDSESDADQEFVKEWAKQHEVPFYTKTVETKAYANEHHLSIEMAARELRYSWFEVLRQELDFGFIALAHNANDQAETLLLNMMRGSGLRGFCGMSPKNGALIRPLLAVTRPCIEDYAKQCGIAFRVDRTNASTDYLRNKIRHCVLPVLQEMTPSLIERMSRNAMHLRQSQQVLEELVEEKRAVLCLPEEGGWRLDVLRLKEEGNVGFWLFSLLQPFGFSSRQIEKLEKGLDAQAGKRFYSKEYVLWKETGSWVLQPVRQAVQSSVSWHVEALEGPFRRPDVSNDTVFLDADVLTFPLTLRPWQHGDRFRPLGMKGFKKVSDFLTDCKIPLRDKEHVQLLCSKEAIVWVVGLRPDDRFKVTEKTRNLLIGNLVRSDSLHAVHS